MFHRTGGTSSLHSESFVINEHQSQIGQSNNNGLYGGVDNRSTPFTQKELELAAHSIGVSPSDFRAVGPARLFRSGSTHQQDSWNYTGYHGVVAVLVKPGVNAVFLVLVDTPTGVAILSQQCHSGFEYHVLSQTMHAFEGDDAVYGLQFPDNFDSLSFANTVKGLIQALQQQRSMMNQGFLSSTQPIQQQIGSPPQSFLSSAEYINQPITNTPMVNYSSPSYGTTSPPQTSTQPQATALSPPPSYQQNAQRSSLELGEPRRRNTLTSKFRNLFRRDQHQYPQQQQTPPTTQPTVSGPSQFVHSAHVGPASFAPDYHRQQAFSPSNITTSTESVLPPMPHNIQQQLLPPSTMTHVGPIERQVSQAIIVNREAPADVHSPPVVRPPAPTIPSSTATTGTSTCNPPPPPPPMMNQQKIKMPQVGDNSKKTSTTTDKKASVTETVSSMMKEEPIPGYVDMQADILKELMKRREKKSNTVEPNGSVSKKNEQAQEKPTAASLPKKQQPATVVKPVERELPESVKRQSIRKKAPPPPPPRSRNSIVTEEVQQQTASKLLPPFETPSSVQRSEGPVIQQPITIKTQLPVFPPQLTVESVDSDKVSGEKHVPIDLLAEIRRPHALKHVTDQEKAKTPTVEDEGHDMMSALKNKITGIRIAMGEDDEDFDDDFN